MLKDRYPEPKPTMVKNKPRRQHFIPEGLLKHFAVQNRLYFYDKENNSIEPRSPRGVFWARNQYTRYVDGGAWGDWSAEEKLANIEDHAIPVFRDIVKAAKIGMVPVLSSKNQAICNRFYIYMAHRNPTWSGLMLDEMGADDAIYEARCIALRRVGMPVPNRQTFETAQGFRNTVEKLKHNNQASFSAGIPSQIDEKIEDLVADLRLSIAVSKSPSARFVIGDCGVTRDDRDENRVFKWLPIAPDVAVSVRPDDASKPYLIEMGVEQADAVNSATWAQSKTIVAQFEDDLNKLIAKETRLKH